MAQDIFRSTEHRVDVCVVGGGMAGLCAAVAAARHGAKVALMQDRPVLGGNASSECRVHICGADRSGQIPHMRETGILEELRLENLRHNPNRVFSIWDTILYEKARFQPNLTLLLNCSCQDARMDGARIRSVTGWQLTTQTYHKVEASVFIDCSGDAILAPLTGAPYRMGREARDEYGESIAPEKADKHTMGMTILFQAREYDTPQKFEPPSWAYVFENEEDLPYGANGHRWWRMGYWWVELGGEHDGIADSEYLKDELLKIALGVWDHIKNRGDHGADNWALEWLQFIPGRRESRRYVGAHVLTQSDIESEGRFDDVVAYGGWTMDDHHPAGFYAAKLGYPATVFHPAPSPFGISYRCLYSRDVENLMFAGRCISATHAAMSSTRLMGTGCSMGQAVGTAAALAARANLLPREVVPGHLRELQQALLKDDCYLPWVKREIASESASAKLEASQGDPEPVRDGVNRQVGEDPHCWECRPGDWVSYTFGKPAHVRVVSLILDSAMERLIQMSYHQMWHAMQTTVPEVMPKAFRIDLKLNDAWTNVATVTDNHQRLVRIPVNYTVSAVRFTLDQTWGSDISRLYGFYLD